MKSARSKACDIMPSVRYVVRERDKNQCVLCGSIYWLEIAHYIPRSKGGLGIEQNLLLLCGKCHFTYDQTSKRQEYMIEIGTYLDEHYPDFDHNKRFY